MDILKAYKQYAWNKIVSCSTCVHSPSSDTDVVGDRLKDLCISHVELNHTKGIHYDVIPMEDSRRKFYVKFTDFQNR